MTIIAFCKSTKMEIRAATEQDIPDIVELLKQTLGESLLPKSVEYWRWKHLSNPFGTSPVLLALDQGEIIGVRAFMRWQWVGEKGVYNAVRAVDTATHANHQGKGVFKKLTLKLVDFCKNQGDDFVFNTPNHQSKPGYLKMGWQEGGKLPICVTIQRPFRIATNLIRNEKTVVPENSAIQYYLDHPDLPALLVDHRGQTKNIITNISPSYLKWRYLDVPLARYVAIGEEEGKELKGLIIGRIKVGRLGRELRITDFFLKRNHQAGELMKEFKISRKTWSIDFCTLSGTLPEWNRQLLGRFNLRLHAGPVVTVRDLKLTELNCFKDFNQWSPSLGDLELF